MRNVKKIGEYISEIFKEKSNSGILITHSGEILKYLKGTRAIVIDNGKIVKEGKVENILKDIKKGGSLK